MEQKQIPYVDDVTVRELWAEAMLTALSPSGTIKIEFATNHLHPYQQGQIDRVSPVARVVLSLGAAALLRDQLKALLDGIQKQFALAMAPAASDKKN